MKQKEQKCEVEQHYVPRRLYLWGILTSWPLDVTCTGLHGVPVRHTLLMDFCLVQGLVTVAGNNLRKRTARHLHWRSSDCSCYWSVGSADSGKACRYLLLHRVSAQLSIFTRQDSCSLHLPMILAEVFHLFSPSSFTLMSCLGCSSGNRCAVTAVVEELVSCVGLLDLMSVHRSSL